MHYMHCAVKCEKHEEKALPWHVLYRRCCSDPDQSVTFCVLGVRRTHVGYISRSVVTVSA